MQNKLLTLLQSPDYHTQSLRLAKKIEEGDMALLTRTIGDVRAIIDGEHPPEVHVQTLKFVKELFLLGREEVVQQVEGQLLPQLVRIAQASWNMPQQYFLSRASNRQVADERVVDQLKRAGEEYLGYCLESIRTWAEWVKFTPEGHRSTFADRMEQLLHAGVKFPSERVLYKEMDREKFERVYKMEFFNSESEFEDSMLSESNVHTLVARELHQCDQLTEQLRLQLQPNEQQTNWKRVKQLLERASIFFHEQSVKLIQEVKSRPEQNDMFSKLLEKQSEFGTLVEDYEFYRAGKIPYSQFYQYYGGGDKDRSMPMSSRQNFRSPAIVKKQTPFSIDNIPNNFVFEPMTVEVAHSAGVSMKKRPINNPSQPPLMTDNREMTTQQQPYRNQYKLQLQNIKSEYEQKLATERQQADRRVEQVKKRVGTNSIELKEEWMKRLESENEQFRKRYEQLQGDLNEKEVENQRLARQLRLTQQQLDIRLSEVEQKEEAYRRASDELGRLKKLSGQQEERLALLRASSNGTGTARDRFQQPPPLTQRQSDNITVTTNRKFEKRIQNLQQQVQILKDQLQSERKKNYREGDLQVQLLKDENMRLKQTIVRLEEAQSKQRLKLDILQVQNLKMQESLKIKSSLSDSLRKENEWMSKTITMPLNATVGTIRPLNEELVKSRHGSLPTHKKLTIRQYLQPTLEGDTYYQELTRQFKVHYRRACFKRKELLYKQSNLELGVITERKALDQLNCTIFVTNHGAKDIEQLRIKILNPVSNDISCENNYFSVLLQGEQQKIYIDARILSYPIGPFIMKLSYVEENRDVTLQVLLPITIVKLMNYRNLMEPISNPQRLVIRYDRKIVNSPDSLSTYFPGVDFSADGSGNQRGRMQIQHQHSQTTFNLELSKEGDNIELQYALGSGREQIMRYYVRVIACLLEK